MSTDAANTLKKWGQALERLLRDLLGKDDEPQPVPVRVRRFTLPGMDS